MEKEKDKNDRKKRIRRGRNFWRRDLCVREAKSETVGGWRMGRRI